MSNSPILIPGMLTFEEYLDRRTHYDVMLQCISLDGQFYEGPELRLFPDAWLDRAHKVHLELLKSRPNRTGRAVGADTAEGGDDTAWASVDDYGLIDLVALRTPDTSVIPGKTLNFAREHKVAPENIIFDRGGGGKEHADALRRQGHPVRTVAFGDPIKPPIKSGINTIAQRRTQEEERYVCKNRRAQMYWDLSQLLNPQHNPRGFGIPSGAFGEQYKELRRQLQVMPKWYDEEGRLFLPPKQARADQREKTDKVTIQKLLGCSPDEADAVVLAVYGLLYKPPMRTAGVAVSGR